MKKVNNTTVAFIYPYLCNPAKQSLGHSAHYYPNSILQVHIKRLLPLNRRWIVKPVEYHFGNLLGCFSVRDNTLLWDIKVRRCWYFLFTVR